MMMFSKHWHEFVVMILMGFASTSLARADESIQIDREGTKVHLAWPMVAGEFGRLTLNTEIDRPLIDSLGISATSSATYKPILQDTDPVVFLRVGSRESPSDRPVSMSVFNVFFDNPSNRPNALFKGKLTSRQIDISKQNQRGMVTVSGLEAGPFSGSWRFTVYPGSRLIQLEAILKTAEQNRAIVYDIGLVTANPQPNWNRFRWIDTEGHSQNLAFSTSQIDRSIEVRHRVLGLETPGGSLAVFPAPHQFFYPRDYTDNQGTIWLGSGHRGLETRLGFGLRQTEVGGGNYAPWFNAPPNTDQHLSSFYVLTKLDAGHAITETLKFTREDRFADLEGYVPFTSHWHLAIAEAAAREKATGLPRTTPDFVNMLKAMNVRAIHLAEFHGDGHPNDSGPLRLPELKSLFEECKRLSDDQLLVLPGEEANRQISLKGAGRETGHWLDLFPRPVYWTMNHRSEIPFSEPVAGYGKVYHVGSVQEMSRLLQEEKGLAWTAHPRIKGSNFTPDAYRDEPLYQSPSWLGAAWKAMPADLSRERLGERVLDLFDDMLNWGDRKYVLGEVDVFKVDHTHELYGHMNVNYLKLDKLPRYEDDWSPILDALRGGQFFVTTGEVLLPDFQVNGKPSGESVYVSKQDDTTTMSLTLKVKGTFPLAFAEIVSGDGQTTTHERIDLSDSNAFDQRTLNHEWKWNQQTWIRMEVWDVAKNGAFTQPVWIEHKTKD